MRHILVNANVHVISMAKLGFVARMACRTTTNAN